ncbi:MAG: OsmC family peroxiredoxin [Woeseia sp.]|nr:OsmC family protein [Woeseia sp.]NNE59706.1 OsmC family peroxiredoxin [Woeseia sp.]
MQNLPHHYAVAAATRHDKDVELSSDGLKTLTSAAPAEFGGPGNLWSPETLLVAAVADCFILSFKAIARGMKLDWVALSCEVKGTLDRVDNTTLFTAFTVKAVLDVPAGTDEQKAERIMQKAEHACLISNSLKAETHLDTEVRFTG